MADDLADWRRPFRILAAGVVLVLVAAAAFLGHALSLSHGRYTAAAADNLGNLTLNLERYLASRLQSIDLVLRTAVTEHQRLGVSPDEAHPGFSEVLRQLQQRLPGQPDLRATNRAGLVVHGAAQAVTRTLDVADRQFFIEATAEPHLVLGLPLKSRVTQRWILPVARGLRDPRGGPAGVVYANLDVEQLVQLFASQKIGTSGVVTLFNAQRQVLLRAPRHPSMQDERPPRLSAPETLAALQAGHTTARYTSVSSVDQRERVTMFRKVGDFPVYILVALATDDVLASWRNELAVAVAFWFALAGAGGLLLAQQVRSGRSAERAWQALRESRQLAEHASASKSRFLAHLSQEVRTPLNGVLGFAQTGHRDADHPAEARRNFARVIEAARVLQAIVNDMVDISRIEAGQLELSPETVRVRAAVRHAVELVQDRARDKGIDLRLAVDEAVPEHVTVDPRRLGQVLLNLLTQAVRNTPAGHVAVTVDVVDAQLMLVVDDSGPGMTAAELDGLFQPLDTASGGDLGLAITHQLVQLMGGTLSATSRPGDGCAFTVRLPLVAAERDTGVDTAPPPDAAPHLRLGGLRVLVAEDNPVDQIVIQGLLELEGAAADVVPDAAQAVARIARQDGLPYHVALLHLGDGDGVARRIRTLDPSLPLIGQAAPDAPDAVAGHVPKPVDPDVLVRTVLRHARRTP